MANILTRAELDALLGRTEPCTPSFSHTDALYKKAGEVIANFLSKLLGGSTQVSLSGVYKANKSSLPKRCGFGQNTPLIAAKITVASPKNNQFWMLIPFDAAIYLDELSAQQQTTASCCIFTGLTHIITTLANQIYNEILPCATPPVKMEVGPLQHWFSVTEASEDDYWVLELTWNLTQKPAYLLVLLPSDIIADQHEHTLIPPAAKQFTSKDLSSALATIPLQISVQLSAGQHAIGTIASWGEFNPLTITIPANSPVQLFANGHIFARGILTQQTDGPLLIQLDYESVHADLG